MHLVSQLLEWVRAVFFGSPGSGRTAPGTGLKMGGSLPVYNPSPEMWSAILAGARRRRAPYVWPSPELPAVECDSITGAFVRAYVLSEDERARVLTAPVGEAR
jgi:hypothetical protein